MKKPIDFNQSGYNAHLKDINTAEAVLLELVNEFKKLVGHEPQDLEEFLALEKIKEHEKTLKELMIYQGRGGMWADWVKFQADARKKRKAEQIQREKQIQELVETTAIISLVIVGVIAAIAAVILWT